MSATFLIKGLSLTEFTPLFTMDAQALQQHRAAWIEVDSEPGYPCRVSLQDATVGETVLALPFCHHPAASPYYAAGPIFVRKTAMAPELEPDEIPRMLLHRQLSVRAYGDDGCMRRADLVPGSQLGDCLRRLFADSRIEYMHLHNAGAGCFNCAAVRADASGRGPA